jgi:glycosyltransferase involved in cell wall biosynthesis
MKIILSTYNFYPVHRGGTEVYTRNLAYYIKEKKGEVLIIAAYDPINDEGGNLLLDNEAVKAVRYTYESLTILGLLFKNQLADDVYSIEKRVWQENFVELLQQLKWTDATHLIMNGISTVSGHSLVKALLYLNPAINIGIVVHTPFMCPKADMIYARTHTRCEQVVSGQTCAACLVTASSGIPITMSNLINRGIKKIPLPGTISRKTFVRLDSLINLKFEALRLLNGKVKAWIVFSDDMKQFLSKQIFFTPDKIKTIRHGIDESVFFRTSSRKDSLPVKFLYAGRFEKIKGVQLLCEAWKSVADEPTKRQLLLVGNWKETQVGQKMVKDLKKRKDVVFYESLEQDKLANLYRTIHCLIIPSQWIETGPLVFHEAIACGCDVITSDVGGQAELAGVYTNRSVLFKSGNNKSLHKAIKNYLAANEQYEYSPISLQEHFDKVSQVLEIK